MHSGRNLGTHPVPFPCLESSWAPSPAPMLISTRVTLDLACDFTRHRSAVGNESAYLRGFTLKMNSCRIHQECSSCLVNWFPYDPFPVYPQQQIISAKPPMPKFPWSVAVLNQRVQPKRLLSQVPAAATCHCGPDHDTISSCQQKKWKHHLDPNRWIFYL